MKNKPNFSREIGRDISNHPVVIPKRMTVIHKTDKTKSDITEPDKIEPDTSESDKSELVKSESDASEPDKTEPGKTELVKSESDASESDKTESNKSKSDSTEDKKAGRPKKPKNEKRKQIILTIGPETFNALSKIPDYRRKLSHYIDENLKEVSKILDDYIIK